MNLGVDSVNAAVVAIDLHRGHLDPAVATMLIGDLLANTGLAVAEYVKGNGTPYFIPIIAADDLTQRKRIPNVVRIAGYSASMNPRPLADWLFKKKGIRKVVTVSQDYTFGHEQCGGFVQVFSNLGGQVLAQYWHPLNTQDFSPYLAQIQEAKPDIVYAMETGADGTRFIQQYDNFGLKGKIPLSGSMNLTDQSIIRTLGDEADGILSAAHFCEGADAPATKKFVADYEKAFNHLPSLYGFSMYSGAMWLAEAIKGVNGKVEDRAAFLAAVRKVVLSNSPLGRPVRLDDYGQPIYDVYIREVKKRADGKHWNTPIEVYPNVSQFWTYNPEEYMAWIAKGFGVEGEVANSPTELRAALARAKRASLDGKPYLIDAQTARVGVAWAEKPWVPTVKR